MLLGRTNFSFVRTALGLKDVSLKSLGLADYELPACPACTHPDSFTGNDVPGIIAPSLITGMGGDSTSPKVHNLNTFQFQEALTYTVGRQNLKFGGNFERIQFNQRSDFFSGGSFNFSSIDDFIRGEREYIQRYRAGLGQQPRLAAEPDRNVPSG